MSVFILGETPAMGWWSQGHSHITAGAISHLPQPLQRFFQENLVFVSELAADEPPGQHYIDIDVYPEFLAGTFPRDLDELISLYGVSFVNQYGKGPWTFADYVETLASEMSVAADEQDWLDLLPTAAAMAHYVEDLHNPLHLTLNYNGQLTGNTGIHARYEGQMVLRHLDELTITPAGAAYLPSVIDFVFDGINVHYPFVTEIMAADDQYPAPFNDAYYAGLWGETGSFTQILFQEASQAVANSWYTAWVNAGSPTTFLQYTADFDGDEDVDEHDLSRWESSYGSGNMADADFDGDSDGTDFLAWQQQYTGELSSSTSANTVPEPVAGILLFEMATIVVWCRFRSHC